MASSLSQLENWQTYSLSGIEPLPPIPGPKLTGFHRRKAAIDYIELLSAPPDDENGSGGHAHVFKVRMNGQSYALKVFKFFDVKEARHDIYPLWNGKVDPATFAFQSDPFFAECRAYGKIQEIQEGLRRPSKSAAATLIAVPCYGYIGLHPQVEGLLREKFGELDWKRPKAQYELLPKRREPFRALVKQLVDDPRTIVNPRKMLRDLRILRAGGVFQMDMYARNYLGGLLVDFSVAWTEPHWCFKAMDDFNIDLRKQNELREFDEMMEAESIKTRVRAFREPLTMKLRERK